MVETRSLQVSFVGVTWKCSFIPLHPDVKQVASGTSATIFQCAGKQNAKLGEDALRQLPTPSRLRSKLPIGLVRVFLFPLSSLECTPCCCMRWDMHVTMG